MSFYELEKKTGKDIKSLQAWSIQKNQRVQTRNFNTVINALQNEISLHFNDFSEYALSVLENNGIIREYVQEIFDDNKPFKTMIDQLLLLDFSEEYYLQDRIGTENIIQKAKVLLSPFYQGTISPLTVITDLKRKSDCREQIYLLNVDRINTEYVIMGGGSNSASVRIKTKDFFSYIINTENILKAKIIE